MFVHILSHFSAFHFLILLNFLLNRCTSSFIFITMGLCLLAIALVVVMRQLRLNQVHLWPKLSCLLQLRVYICRVRASHRLRIFIHAISHLLLLMMNWEINFRAWFVVIKRTNILFTVLRIVLSSWGVIFSWRTQGCIVHVTILYICSL